MIVSLLPVGFYPTEAVPVTKVFSKSSFMYSHTEKSKQLNAFPTKSYESSNEALNKNEINHFENHFKRGNRPDWLLRLLHGELKIKDPNPMKPERPPYDPQHSSLPQYPTLEPPMPNISVEKKIESSI